MFERFTARARRVVVLAQEEARALDHNYIGTEHFLLGLLHEADTADSTAAQALNRCGVTLDSARTEVERLVGRGEGPSPADHLPFTLRAKKALEGALREALDFDHDYIGTGHLLLGLLKHEGARGAEVLINLGAEPDEVRAQVFQVLIEKGRLDPKAGAAISAHRNQT